MDPVTAASLAAAAPDSVTVGDVTTTANVNVTFPNIMLGVAAIIGVAVAGSVILSLLRD